MFYKFLQPLTVHLPVALRARGSLSLASARCNAESVLEEVPVLGTRCQPRPAAAHCLLQAGTELSPRFLEVGGRQPFLRARPMCCGTPRCAAPSAPSWPFVCSSERSLGVTRALPLGRRAGTRCLIEPRSQPQPGTRLWERSFLQRYSARGCLDLFCRAPRTKCAAARVPCV